MTITVRYSCHQCGLCGVSCEVAARIDEHVLDWMNMMIATLSRDHDRRSPHCHPTSLKDIMVPVGGADRIGGPPVN